MHALAAEAGPVVVCDAGPPFCGSCTGRSVFL